MSPLTPVEMTGVQFTQEFSRQDHRNRDDWLRTSAAAQICIRDRGVSGDIVSLERVNAINRVRLSLDDFTMGVFRALNVAPTQLHPNSWAYLQGRKQSSFIECRWAYQLPTKGRVRVYKSVHPIIDIEGHMAQSGKKNLALFQTLRKEMAAKAKAVGKTDVPNLKESVVEVHVHSGTKSKVELPPQPGKGKDVKKVRAALLGTGSVSGAGSASGEKGPEFGLIELPEIFVRKDISITLPDTILNSIDGMEADHLVRTMVEFGSKALVLSRRVGSLYRREVKEGGRENVEELQGKVDKLEEENAALEKAKESWETERKRLAAWRVRCLDSEEKLNKRIGELEEDYDDLKDKYDGVVGELDDLKNSIIQEHINGFEKGLRQANFFHQGVDVTDSRFDVNKDVVDGKLVQEDEDSGNEEAQEKVAKKEKKAGDSKDAPVPTD
ncbi:hypothetical protein DEO72_LG10g2284 [Vigna unguiculata]|uniref:Uncharacterized protein n=1 Tax=Vigna unguiculata TaxID=3917 RepID=A0A4D6NDU6_VIGUN|nr:hypothetical protein DEO72_LG10g2284 [Vigna unguiculata]